MDDIAVRPSAKITSTEVQRRRKIVRQADANNRLEGIYREPATDAAVEAFVRGDIEATDLVRLFKGQRDQR